MQSHDVPPLTASFLLPVHPSGILSSCLGLFWLSLYCKRELLENEGNKIEMGVHIYQLHR